VAMASSIMPWHLIAGRQLADLAQRVGPRQLAPYVSLGPYQDIAQLMKEDPRCSLRNPLFQRVNQPNVGEYLMPGSPLCFDHRSHRHIHPAPGLGEHTDEVLKEILGCSDQEIRRLRNASIRHASGVTVKPLLGDETPGPMGGNPHAKVVRVPRAPYRRVDTPSALSG
jgi:hypothetical protein